MKHNEIDSFIMSEPIYWSFIITSINNNNNNKDDQIKLTTKFRFGGAFSSAFCSNRAFNAEADTLADTVSPSTSPIEPDRLILLTDERLL